MVIQDLVKLTVRMNYPKIILELRRSPWILTEHTQESCFNSMVAKVGMEWGKN